MLAIKFSKEKFSKILRHFLARIFSRTVYDNKGINPEILTSQLEWGQKFELLKFYHG